jgi:hypothetical protein
VLRSLNSCESEDAKSFVQLCLDLTLKPDDTHYHFNACLVDTHGWMTATTNTRDRIVEAARQYLLVATDRADEAREDNPSQIVIGPMAALLLLYEQDVAWLRKRDGSWWMRWATLIVYDLNLYMSGERAETKHGLFALLHEQAAPVIRTRVLRIATIDGDPHRRLFEDMLEFYERIPDREFDDALATTIASGHVCADREFEAIAFLLKRKHAGIYDYSIDMMGGNLAVVRPSLRSSAMAATMLASLSRAIDRIIAFMQCEPSLARQGVERMASELRFRQARGEAEKMWNGVPSTKLGMAVEELIAIVPYREDRRGIRFMRMRGPEYAEDFRSDSVNALTKREDSAAVEALRRIERRYRDTLPWVSRLRAHAELAFGRDHWTPFLPTVVAEVLDAGDKRLIRSPEDVLEGIAAAIEHFQYQLQHHSLPKVEALWNLPSHRAPTPKKEEWASDCICDTIREYFNAHGVSVEREVQIRRRLVSRASGGRPGSKPDLFATLPARGPNGSQPIIVPIEVKRSDNPEAKAALRDQLAARYMTESGANAGAYIVVWFDAPDMGTHRPVWPSIEDARSDLEGQAKAVHAETGRTVRVLVVDASLH